MWGWIALSGVALALIILGMVAAGTARTLKPLRSAAIALQASQERVGLVQQAVEGMQSNLADVRGRVEITQERAAALSEARRRDRH